MNNKQLFINALSTLFFSWGSDTPPEAIWTANDLLIWYETEYNVALNIRFEEDGSNYNQVIEAIRNS